MRKDRLAYSDEAISSLIIKGENGEHITKGKERRERRREGGREVGRKKIERKKKYDETQSRLKTWATYFLGAQIS